MKALSSAHFRVPPLTQRTCPPSQTKPASALTWGVTVEVYVWQRPGPIATHSAPRSAKSSIIRELLKLTQRPEIISFAGGLPAPEVFPVERFQEACERVLSTQAFGGAAIRTDRRLPALARVDRGADGALRHRRHRRQRAHHLRLATGAGPDRQAADQSRRPHSGGVAHLSRRAAGLRPDGRRVRHRAHRRARACRPAMLEGALRSGPKFMYILPNFQNPGGVTLSRRPARRTGAGSRTSTASRSSKTIPTDSCATKASTLHRWSCSIAPTCCATTATCLGNVIYLSTFSKVLAPDCGWAGSSLRPTSSPGWCS